jgi:hypothetical protein
LRLQWWQDDAIAAATNRPFPSATILHRAGFLPSQPIALVVGSLLGSFDRIGPAGHHPKHDTAHKEAIAGFCICPYIYLTISIIRLHQVNTSLKSSVSHTILSILI